MLHSPSHSVYCCCKLLITTVYCNSSNIVAICLHRMPLQKNWEAKIMPLLCCAASVIWCTVWQLSSASSACSEIIMLVAVPQYNNIGSVYRPLSLCRAVCFQVFGPESGLMHLPATPNYSCGERPWGVRCTCKWQWQWALTPVEGHTSLDLKCGVGICPGVGLSPNFTVYGSRGASSSHQSTVLYKPLTL